LIVHSDGKTEIPRTSRSGRVRGYTPVASLLGLLVLLKLGLSEKFGLILLCLKTEDFHLHHLNLQVLSLLNIYARGEGLSGRVYLGSSALLIGESGTVYSGGDRTMVASVRNVDVLGFRVVLGFLVVRGKTGEVESSPGSGGVGNVGGTGADTARAEASEEGSTVCLVRNGHLGEIGGKRAICLEGAEGGRNCTRSREQGGGRVR
jgi:hypothetical protein